MDQLDKKIIEMLKMDSRLSITALSDAINLSRPSVTERIARLRDEGIITAFTIKTSDQKLGLSVSFFIEISDIKGSVEHVLKILKSNSYVTEVYCVTGVTNYIARASMPDIEMMHAFLSELRKHCNVVSSIILESIL